jgi:hypothetical protein
MQASDGAQFPIDEGQQFLKRRVVSGPPSSYQILVAFLFHFRISRIREKHPQMPLDSRPMPGDWQLAAAVQENDDLFDCVACATS